MKKREFHLGPGAASLMLIAVTLSLSVLGALSLMNTRGDVMLVRRSEEVAREIAALNELGEYSLAELDAALAACGEAETEDEYLTRVAQTLPAGMSMEGRTVFWTETSESGRELECAVEIGLPGEFPRAAWTIHRHWPDDGGME